MIWVDGVGGFLVLARSPWLVGGPAAERDGAICVQAALRRQEAELILSSGDYSFRRLNDAGYTGEEGGERSVPNGSWASAERPLRRRDTFRLGNGVHFEFCCPNPLSTSARLTVEPRFRFRPHADAILLLADTLLLGTTRDCHMVASHADQTIVLFRRGTDWFCKPLGTGAGAPVATNERVELGQRTEICGVSLTLEPA